MIENVADRAAPPAEPEPAAAPPPAPTQPTVFDETPTTGEMIQALRFNHLIEMQTKLRMTDLAASFYALVETLTVQGVLPLDLYEKRRETTVAREEQRTQQEALVQLNNAGDKYQMKDLPQIDCPSLVSLCKARCCTLVFPLSPQDLDEGVVRFDYSRPYQIRRRDDLYCVHNTPGTCNCTVYEHRPSICRSYDCREDKRIWTDFEKRIPAP